METIADEITNLFLSMHEQEQKQLLADLHNVSDSQHESLYKEIRDQLFTNTVQKCAHCESPNFIGWGIDKGLKRFKCKDCNRTFTEFSGTWISHLHHKDLVDRYVRLLLTEKSVSKIAIELQISIQTAFDWRHKILSALNHVDKGEFKEITESDETFFLHSNKGEKQSDRKPRKRGGRSKKRGISNEQVAVIVTADRNRELDLTVATMGRISKKDIADAIGNRVTDETILCTDSHASYKGFALDNNLDHHPIKAITKEYVKNKVYHIQHVNSIDSRLKPWINIKFKGVSTKYLQNYLTWFRFKELLMNSTKRLYDFILKSIVDSKAWRRYKLIGENHDLFLVNNAILE